MWSGSSGLLYAPVSEVLPQGDFQLGVLGAGIANLSDIQAPVELGMRMGLAPGVELDASAGLIATSTVLPVDRERGRTVEPAYSPGSVGTSAAIQAKIAAQFVATQNNTAPLMTDTFANFSGLSVEVPLQLTLGAVSGLLSFGVTGSLWYPYAFKSDGVTPVFGPVAWLYVRAGIMLDLGSVTAGVSASTRTQQLPGRVCVPGLAHSLRGGSRNSLAGAGHAPRALRHFCRGIPGFEQLLFHGRRRAGIPVLTITP